MRNLLLLFFCAKPWPKIPNSTRFRLFPDNEILRTCYRPTCDRPLSTNHTHVSIHRARTQTRFQLNIASCVHFSLLRSEIMSSNAIQKKITVKNPKRHKFNIFGQNFTISRLAVQLADRPTDHIKPIAPKLAVIS